VGYASALSFVFFLLIVAISVLLFAGLRRLQTRTGEAAP
jgi:ABC-type sugar transport system permease subunit